MLARSFNPSCDCTYARGILLAFVCVILDVAGCSVFLFFFLERLCQLCCFFFLTGKDIRRREVDIRNRGTEKANETRRLRTRMDDDFINRTRLNNDIRGVRTIAIKNVKNKVICRSVMGIDDETMLEGHKG